MVPSRFASLLTKVRRRGWGDRLLLAEAGWGLIMGSALIRFAPFKVAVRSGSRTALPRRREPGAIDPVVWSINAVAARLPWRTLCFQKALAVQKMLRRRGLDARLHYGLGHRPDRNLEAHVWVSVDGTIVIGGEVSGRFSQVATFPADSPRAAHGG